MTRTAFRLAAWALLAAIVVLTIGPGELRPATGASAQFERAGIFLIVGILFALAYPRHIGWALVLIVFATVGLEMLQNLLPERHGRGTDALAKLAGAAIGLGIGWLAIRIWTAKGPAKRL